MLSWRWRTSSRSSWEHAPHAHIRTPDAFHELLYAVAAAEFDGLAMVCCRCTRTHPGRSAPPAVCHTAVFSAYVLRTQCAWIVVAGEASRVR